MAGSSTASRQSAYLGLSLAELTRRVDIARQLLGPHRCQVCPRLCKVDRLQDISGLCKIGRKAIVASHFPHFGEERCLRGHKGSGTIFFSGCSLRCVFCQNHDISWVVQGDRVTPARLAEMMVDLQSRGCHNINFVTPEHVVPQILEALPDAVARGLSIPIVYNTSSYEGHTKRDYHCLPETGNIGTEDSRLRHFHVRNPAWVALLETRFRRR